MRSTQYPSFYEFWLPSPSNLCEGSALPCRDLFHLALWHRCIKYIARICLLIRVSSILLTVVTLSMVASESEGKRRILDVYLIQALRCASVVKKYYFFLHFVLCGNVSMGEDCQPDILPDSSLFLTWSYAFVVAGFHWTPTVGRLFINLGHQWAQLCAICIPSAYKFINRCFSWYPGALILLMTVAEHSWTLLRLAWPEPNLMP